LRNANKTINNLRDELEELRGEGRKHRKMLEVLKEMTPEDYDALEKEANKQLKRGQ
jgi:predicted RNA-binding protein with EMAP domain